MKLTFLGATGTVTGSKYAVSIEGKNFLVDCGLFQGLKELRLRNWEPLPVAPSQIDAVILTHAHLDHSGYLPLLIKSGFRGPVYCTSATLDLCRILLPDSGRLQEEDARYANHKGYSKHTPALPLYTAEDAEKALLSFHPMPYDKRQSLGPYEFFFRPAGHILGSSLVTIEAERSLSFSGDLGRPRDSILIPPAAIERSDYLVVESTYGNRTHDKINPKDRLAEIINRVFQRGGKLLIPAFAVGRTQTLLAAIHELKTENKIPNLPVYMDSPMAITVTDLLHKHAIEHHLSPSDCTALCDTAYYVNEVAQSQGLDRAHLSSIILSAAGMATGGRVLHHLRALGPHPENCILFVGYQAQGTRGEHILNGRKQIKMHGEMVSIKAEVEMINAFSAHADAEEILSWLENFKTPPRKVFITHGEPEPAKALKEKIEAKFGWNCVVPKYNDTVELS